MTTGHCPSRFRHRTLTRVEAQTREFIEQRAADEAEAEREAEVSLAQAQRRLDEKVAEVETRADLDTQTKQIMARNLQEGENRKLDVQKTNIEARKNTQVRASEERMERRKVSLMTSIAGIFV